jgi:hypothetical protein
LNPVAAETLKSRYRQVSDIQGIPMSSPKSTPHDAHEPDAIEAVLPLIPLVLPLVGGVLIFLLAFIAVYMA